MMAFLTGLLTLPRWAKITAGIVLLLALAFIVHKCAVRDAVEADRNASNAAATTTAREADQSAQEAAEGKSTAIEQENDRAKEAARDSDDPLADAMRSLRHPAR